MHGVWMGNVYRIISSVVLILELTCAIKDTCGRRFL